MNIFPMRKFLEWVKASNNSHMLLEGRGYFAAGILFDLMIYYIENMKTVWKSWGDGICIIIWVFIWCDVNYSEMKPRIMIRFMLDWKCQAIDLWASWFGWNFYSSCTVIKFVDKKWIHSEQCMLERKLIHSQFHFRDHLINIFLV